MTVDAYLTRYRALLTKRAEIDVEIQVLEKEMELLTKSAGPDTSIGQSEAQAFIENHRTKLDADDLEFLRIEFRRIGEVVTHTQIPATSLKRMADSGKISEGPKTESGHRRFNTVSVMTHLLTAAEDEAG